MQEQIVNCLPCQPVYLAEFGEDDGLHLYAEHNYAIKAGGAFNPRISSQQFFWRGLPGLKH